jgi:protein-S-isoprenylcysteine O-methyltransferase Ste14
MEFVSRLIDKLDVIVAGVVGSLVASWWHRDDIADWKSWVIFMITGIACALYLTGMVSSHLDITEPSNVAGVGFLLGTFGGSLMTAVHRAIKSADLWALIRSKFGGGNP